MVAQLTVMVRPELLAELKRAAEREECSVSLLVRQALRERFMPPTANKLAEQRVLPLGGA